MEQYWNGWYPEYHLLESNTKMGTRGVWRVIDAYPSLY